MRELTLHRIVLTPRALLIVLLASVAWMLVALPGNALAQFGTSSFSAALSSTQAGAHGDFSTTISLNTDSLGNPEGQLKDVTVTLPEGLIGNPLAIEHCSLQALDRFACPRTSQVGELGLSIIACKGVVSQLSEAVEAGATTINVPNAKPFCFDGTFEHNNVITIGEGTEAETVKIAYVPDASTIELQAPLERAHPAGAAVSHTATPNTGGIPLFNVQPSPGHVATFAASVLLANVFVEIGVKPDGKLVATIKGISTLLALQSTTLTLWGVPAASSHDAQRCNELGFECGPLIGAEPVPFLMNPSACAGPLPTQLSVDSWQGQTDSSAASLPPMSGCSELTTAPTIGVTPSTTRRDSPAGYEVELTVPQVARVAALGTPPIEGISLTLPSGTSLSPGLANGLSACSDAELEGGGCPDASKVGGAEIVSPLLEEPLRGSVYIGTPTASARYRLFVRVSAGATVIELRGDAKVDEATGMLTATFERTPALPFSKLKLSFFGGPGAALANPPSCGPATTTAAVHSYSGQVADLSSSFSIDEDSGGGACPSFSPFVPAISAGTTNAVAAQSTPFVLTISRNDGEQDLSSFSAHLPPGLIGMVGSVPRCEEPQAATGACPQSSQIGAATVAAGAGPLPYDVSGPVYLTGPYGGAPFGLDIVIRALAGPFDLGTALVRSRVSVDPSSLALTIASDPFPQTLGGIPLRLRRIGVNLDRAGFLLNPSGCAPQTIGATIVSAQGATVERVVPFQVAGCMSLPFTPRLTASTQSGTSEHGNGVGLDIEVVNPSRSGSALSAVTVQMPSQLRPRLTTIRHACLTGSHPASTAACPGESIVGQATVRSPVTAAPLSGPIYLLSHGGRALPALFTRLRGEGLEVDLEGQLKISSKNVITASFTELPDVPLSSFDLALPRGPHSMLGATTNLCGKRLALSYRFAGHSGAMQGGAARLAVAGCPHPGKRVRPKRRRHLPRSAGQARGKKESLMTRAITAVVCLAPEGNQVGIARDLTEGDAQTLIDQRGAQVRGWTDVAVSGCREPVIRRAEILDRSQHHAGNDAWSAYA